MQNHHASNVSKTSSSSPWVYLFFFFSPIIICTFLLRCKHAQRSVIYMRIATNAAAAAAADDDDGDDDDGISFTKNESKQFN